MSNDAFIEKIRSLSFNVKGGTGQFFHSRNAIASHFDKDDARHIMVKDPAMFREIRNGNASDKYLTRDIVAFNNEKAFKAKEKAREEKLKRVTALRSEYRKKYKQEA